MRLSVSALCLLVSSCGAPSAEPATPVVAKVAIEPAPPEAAAAEASSPEPESPAEADTAANDESSSAGGEGGLEVPVSAAPVPHVRTAKVVVSGALPQPVIERIVRQGFGRVRLCYDIGLARDPSMRGTVNAGFVIEADGSVSNPRDLGSSLPDATLVRCVVSTFYGCSFPQPDSGTVSVEYSLVLSP